MSVIVRGMEMPKNCIECRFRQYEYCDLQRQDVYAVNIMDYALSFERHPSCPLIGLPPHGRLIDADKLLEKAYWDYNEATHDYNNFKIVSHYEIVDAPTVIEAEGREE